MVMAEDGANDIRRGGSQLNRRRGEVMPVMADDPRELHRVYPAGFD